MELFQDFEFEPSSINELAFPDGVSSEIEQIAKLLDQPPAILSEKLSDEEYENVQQMLDEMMQLVEPDGFVDYGQN